MIPLSQYAGGQEVIEPSFQALETGLTFARVSGCRQTVEARQASKHRNVFGCPVKKTYLTWLGLTAVLANKIKGFVLEKNRFPEAVKIPAFLPKWANVDAVPRKRESPGGIYFTTKNTKSTET